MKSRTLISVVGSEFVRLIVPELLLQTIKYRRDRTSKDIVSILENTYACSAILLTVCALEAYVNRLSYFEGNSKQKNVTKKIRKFITKYKPELNQTNIENYITEIFVLRDIVAHNHIYEVRQGFNDLLQPISLQSKLIEGYGDTKKKMSSSSRTKKTNLLKLNIQPLNIQADDLIKVLFVFDCVMSIFHAYSQHMALPTITLQLDGEKKSSVLSKIISEVQLKLESKAQASTAKLFRVIQNEISPILEPGVLMQEDSSIYNFCPSCGTYGFYRIGETPNCLKCGEDLGRG